MKKQLVVLFILFSLTAQAQNPFRIFSQSQEALAQGDTAAYLTYAKDAYTMAPFDLWFAANLARAYAMNGQKIRCIEILDDLSVLGFDFDILSDEGFRNIWTHSLLKVITKRAHRDNPKEISSIAHRIPEKDLIVKAIAFDPRRNIFYAGSIYQRKIVAVQSDGSTRDAIPEAKDGLLSPVGMKVDAARNYLWVLDALQPTGTRMQTPEMNGKARVHQYDLESMKLLNTYSTDDSLEHLFNDLAVLWNGDVFLTDSKNGTIYTVNREKQTLDLWYENNDMYFPNGITASTDQKYLFVSHWQGINRISLAEKSSLPLNAKVKTTLTGIDGLYFYNDHLIAVQNSAGPQSRIMRFDLSRNYDAVTKATVLESGHNLHNIPTTGLIDGDDFYYIANSQLQSFDREGKIFPAESMSPTYILKISLDTK